MRTIRRLLTIGILLALTGCAHPILMTPDSKALTADGVQPIPKNVGYFISAENKNKEFVTAGGGGDKVSHYPYRDMEPGLYRVLSNVFADVTVLKAQNDTETIRNRKISFVFVPTIVPSSSSDGFFTWPPTKFSLNVDCIVYDGDGKQIATKSVIGLGTASFSEFSGNFGLAAQRASTDALRKLQADLIKSPEFSR